MKTIEKAAGELYPYSKWANTRAQMSEEDYLSDKQQDAFIKGAEFSNMWHDIERDKDGFATYNCLNEIFSYNNVLVLSKSLEIEHVSNDKEYWRGEIERNTDYNVWRVIEI